MPHVHVTVVPIDQFLNFTHCHAILRSLFLQQRVWDLMSFHRVRVRVRVCAACVVLRPTFYFGPVHISAWPHIYSAANRLTLFQCVGLLALWQFVVRSAVMSFGRPVLWCLLSTSAILEGEQWPKDPLSYLKALWFLL